ncbi:MAG: hypothetical protein JJE16_10215 [Nitrospiraceae bacterium]|nr:hypothetical protein [Nitrospiraceae bacterium]
MLTRWMRTIIGGVLLLILTACAESLHQTQRMAMLSQAPENGYADVYDPASPFYSSPGFWWRPFGYYPGFYGYGPGYRSGYPYPYSGYSSGRSFSSPSGSGPRPSPPANAPSRMFKRKN